MAESPSPSVDMFKNLRTSTKLLLLCSVFVGALVVTTFGLVAEKQIAINFVRKELVGVRHLEALRAIYSAILTGTPSSSTADKQSQEKHAETGLAGSDSLDTAALERTLNEATSKLASAPDEEQRNALFVDALTAARNLASRIGDDSNLTLDPDLDSYYVQDIVVAKIPTLLSQIGELRSQQVMSPSAQSSPETPAVRALVLDGMIRSTLDSIERDLQASYRGAGGSSLRQGLDGDVDAMISAANAYLDAMKAKLRDGGNGGAVDRSYATAVESGITAWTASQAELKRLLQARLSTLLSKLRSSLLLNGLLAVFSLGFAIATGRLIVQPLLQLGRLADDVGQTKDYNLRAEHASRDEIGRLATAFNAMLAELAAAREREADAAARRGAMQAELARVARITTMGEMAASIAHEINQPLAAIVNNANASLRWLGQDPPNVERARSVLERVVSDGARASEVIGSIRSMLDKSGQERIELDVNELIRRGDDIRAVRPEASWHQSANRTRRGFAAHRGGAHPVAASASQPDRQCRRVRWLRPRSTRACSPSAPKHATTMA